MHCTLLIPDLLPPRAPGDAPYAEVHAPALETLLAQGDATCTAPVVYEDWLCGAFCIARQQDAPVAPLLMSFEGSDPEERYWLCADPVYVRADRNRLVIAGRAEDIGADEARDMIAALNLHFAPDGIEFRAPSPRRWYAGTRQVPRLVTTPVARAVNRSVEPNLPQGADALAWHRVINEAQMILHAHPANAAREERGAMVVNSVWLWGGGTRPQPASRPSYTGVWSNEPLPHGLAAAAGIGHYELPSNFDAWIGIATGEQHLLVCDGPNRALVRGDIETWRNEVVSLDATWIEPMLAALRSGRIAALTLVACNCDCLLEAKLTRSSLRRFWRRAQPLAHYAATANAS